MAPTEGRVARPERRWDCRRGTPISHTYWGCIHNILWHTTSTTVMVLFASQWRHATAI